MSSKSSINGVAAIILAAGESKRLGKVKQLLPWRGKTLIEFIIQNAHDCNLDPINVILGANYDLISPIIKSYEVNILYNPRWKEGKGTSISIGINSLPENVNAVIIFIVDQPYLDEKFIKALIKKYEITKADIIAPYIRNTQSNPVLFDRSVFSELKNLKDEEGGRNIFNKFVLEKIYWDDEKVLWDIDTKADYKKAIKWG